MPQIMALPKVSVFHAMDHTTYKIPRLIDDAIRIFSFLFICRFHKMNQGRVARTKSAAAEIAAISQLVIQVGF